jgi:hypothetical protein
MAAKKTWFVPLLITVLGVLFILSLGYFVRQHIQSGEEPLQNLILNSLLLSIPLILLYTCLGLLGYAWYTRRVTGRLGRGLARFIYITPRLAGILIILFTAMFALDMFGTGEPWYMQLLGFIIHAAPAILLAITLALAWRWEWVGGAAFMVCGVVFLRFVFGGGMFAFGNLLLFVLPMLAVGGLFLAGWFWRPEIRV